MTKVNKPDNVKGGAKAQKAPPTPPKPTEKEIADAKLQELFCRCHSSKSHKVDPNSMICQQYQLDHKDDWRDANKTLKMKKCKENVMNQK